MVTLLAACGGGSKKSTAKASTGGSFTIAVPADLSGEYATAEGLSSVAGLTAAVDTMNAQGGIDGHHIDLKIFNAQSNQTDAEIAVRDALAARPNMIFDGTISTELTGDSPLYEAAHIPVLTLVVDDALISPLKPYYFGIGETDNQYAQELIGGAESLLGVSSLSGKRIAVAADNTTGIETKLAATKRLLPPGTIVDVQEREPDATTFASQAQSIVASKPSLVYVLDISGGAAVDLQALETAGYRGPILQGPGLVSAAVLKAATNPDLATVYNIADITQAPNVVAALAKYGEASSGPYPVWGWVAGYLISAGLAKCGYPCSSVQMIHALETAGPINPPDNLVFTPLNFSATKHASLTSAKATRVENGSLASFGPLIKISSAGNT